MRLSDIMASMHLAQYAEVGLVIFGATFVAVCIRLLLFTSKAELEHAGSLPLADDHGTTAAATELEK